MGSNSDGCKRKEHREETLGDFIKLNHSETVLADDPLFSKEAADQYTDKKWRKQDNSKKGITNFATNSKPDKEEKKGYTDKTSIVYCMQWRPSFGLMQDLHGKDSEGKDQTLGQQKIYAMAPTNLWPVITMPKPASKDCRIYKECNPTGIHSYVKKAPEENTDFKVCTKDAVKCASVKAKLGTEVISMYVVPVWVGHRNSRKVIKTCAMLDNYSQGSSIKDEIIEYLGISSRVVWTKSGDINW